MVNDSQSTFGTLILAEVISIKLHVAGNGDVSTNLLPLGIGSGVDVNTEYLSCIAGILTTSIECEVAVEGHPGRYEPVVGIEHGVGGVVIASGRHCIGTAVGVETLTSDEFPVEAVAVLVENSPVASLSFIFEIPEIGVTLFQSVVGLGTSSCVKSVELQNVQVLNSTFLQDLTVHNLSLHFLHVSLAHLGVDAHVVHTCRSAESNSCGKQKY